MMRILSLTLDSSLVQQSQRAASWLPHCTAWHLLQTSQYVSIISVPGVIHHTAFCFVTLFERRGVRKQKAKQKESVVKAAALPPPPRCAGAPWISEQEAIPREAAALRRFRTRSRNSSGPVMGGEETARETHALYTVRCPGQRGNAPAGFLTSAPGAQCVRARPWRWRAWEPPASRSSASVTAPLQGAGELTAVRYSPSLAAGHALQPATGDAAAGGREARGARTALPLPTARSRLAASSSNRQGTFSASWALGSEVWTTLPRGEWELSPLPLRGPSSAIASRHGAPAGPSSVLPQGICPNATAHPTEPSPRAQPAAWWCW